MRRSIALTVGILALVAPTSTAQEALAPETIATIKAASVYIRVEGDGWGGSGSGFVVAADKERVLVVTNHHVAVKLPPGVKPKPPVVSVVFGSGTKAEREYPAIVVGADEERDLAVLRIVGVKDVPQPISYLDPPKAVETMGVFSFGYPFGQSLSVGKGFPAVTVGKASVSSLRDGDDGELAVIQIDGNLNPGNSGGPVVDAKGRLVGVAVSRIRDGQGIGFLIPAAEVGRLLGGRVGRVRVVSGKGTDGKLNARLEAELVDPAAVLRTATAYYVVVPPKGKSPDAGMLEKHPDARKLTLKIQNGVASGEIAVEKAEGTVVVQVVGDRGAGADPIATRPRAYSLAPAAKPEDLAGPPPAGWKEYVSPGRAFVVWLPEKPVRQAEERRSLTVAGETLAGNGVTGKTADGLVYRVETIELPPVLAKLAARVYPAFRNALREETKGRFTESIEAQAGTLAGAEYRIEAGSEVTRVRVYLQGGRIYTARIVGTAEQVAAAEAETILVSFRKPGDLVVKGPVTPPDVAPKIIAGGKEPTILGSDTNHPKFRTIGPDGAILIGLEVRFGKFGDMDIARAMRPIYRVNGKEELGKQIGDNLTGSVTMKAKDGYAVGGITAKADWWCNGFSLTFMKVKADGTLDTKDSYESQWAGFNGNRAATKVMSDGAPVVGIVGRIAGTETYALGLLYKGQIGSKNLTGVKPPTILGTIQDRKFKVVGPDGGILIGVEARFDKFGNTPIVRAVRPIYRADGKEKPGDLVGTDLNGAVTLKAKDGYAVGGVTGKSGAWCNGFSLTFMKVKPDGSLDSNDSYESDWVGFDGKSEVFKVMSDGPPAIGIVGRMAGRDTTAFGLLFRGQEEFDLDTEQTDPERKGTAGLVQNVLPNEKDPVIIAGGNAPKYKDVAPDAGLLIGLELGLGKFGNDDVIKAVRPIYRVGDKEKVGEQHGTSLDRVSTLKAKAGYGVGAITFKFGWNFDGCSLTFMKVVDGKLNPKDSYESEWVGWNGPKELNRIESDGRLVVGIVGRASTREATGLGLLFKGQEGFDPDAPKVLAIGKDPHIFGTIQRDPKFKTVGPDGAVLIGVEVRFARFGATEIARAVRPIYRVNGKEEFGKQFGDNLAGSVTMKAKEGYAVGGMTCKSDRWCNGFSLTFMKVKADGTLDPKDSYESQWAGFNGNSDAARVVSDGAPVVGVVGKIVRTETTAFGLLYKGQEAFDPDAKP